jgi:multidrug efflux system membrane fusion protein
MSIATFSRRGWIEREVLLLSIMAWATVGCSRHPATNAGPPPQVSVAAVLEKDVAQWDDFSGRVAATESVEIRPRVSGYIERVAFAEGAEVNKGDVLFVIDQRPYRAEFQRTSAELTRSRTHAALAETEVARAERLLKSRAISEEERDERVSAAAEANAGLLAAQAAVETARLNLSFTEVRSPIAGRTGRALITAGNLVNAQPNPTLLTTVVSLNPVYVEFTGDEQSYLRYVEMVRRRERVSSRVSHTPVRIGLATEAGFPRQGYVDFVDNAVDPATGTIRARAVVDNADHTLIPGLFARVQFLGSGTYRALLIDDKAVLTDQDRKYVFVVDADNRAQRRDVAVDRMIEGLRVVTKGLERGDRIIVYGATKVFMPGMVVTPQTIRMGDPPPVPHAQNIPTSSPGRALT